MGSSEWRGWLIKGLKGERLENRRQRGLVKRHVDESGQEV